MTDQKKPILGTTITTRDGTQIYYKDWGDTAETADRNCQLFGVRRPVGALVAATCRSLRTLGTFGWWNAAPGTATKAVPGHRTPKSCRSAT